MIQQTIERLEKASVGANGMGSRYARLLQLLWRKAPKRNRDPQPSDGKYNINPAHTQYDQTGGFTPIHLNGVNGSSQFQTQPRQAGTGTFSWLDLGATWNFATQNNSTTASQGGESVDLDVNGIGGIGMDMDGMSPSNFNFGDIGLLSADYSLLEGDNPHLLFWAIQMLEL